LERVKSALFVSCLSHAPKFPVSFLPDTEMQIFSCSNQRQVFTRGFGAQGKMAEEMGDALVVQADDLKGSFVLRLPFLKNENELPDALILAQKPGLKTLGEGIEWMRQSLKNPIPAVGVVEHQGRHWSYFHHLSSSDQFWMPKLNTTLACDYGELIGKTYLHQNHPETQTETFWFIMEAQQMLSFKLNETGAMTHNVFKVSPDFLSLGGMGGALPDGVKPEELPVWPKKFVLNGPFLAALWRKDAEWPYLVCWVDSDEVMELK
ncbi:MAG: hypothetical protein OJI67_09290, partial [Prosthecobacter sp.]|nr:hypothetical protein [Prosthecobacter sp.]